MPGDPDVPAGTARLLVDVADVAKEVDGASRTPVTLDGDWSTLLVRTDTLDRLRAALAALDKKEPIGA